MNLRRRTFAMTGRSSLILHGRIVSNVTRDFSSGFRARTRKTTNFFSPDNKLPHTVSLLLCFFCASSSFFSNFPVSMLLPIEHNNHRKGGSRAPREKICRKRGTFIFLYFAFQRWYCAIFPAVTSPTIFFFYNILIRIYR